MATFQPAFLAIGTEVSAKYRGAFCEAKVKRAVKRVSMKIALKESQSSVMIADEHIVSGVMKLGNMIEFKHPESSQVSEGIINKITDQSTYTVVFNDGDERTLRRTQLCLKGDKHFEESETLDNLPLSHPEHFGTPVLKKQKNARGRAGESESEKEESSSEDEIVKRETYKSRHQELVGRTMLVEVIDKRKGALTPVLVVLPDAHPIELKNRDHLLVRSFRDTKYMAVNRKDLKDFSRDIAIKNEDKALKAAFERALLYYDNSELPINWNREELLGPEEDDGDDSDDTSDDDEQCEEKDRFVAQLYKFMDDRGTPINKGPCIGNKDLNLYRLFRVVQNIGGYNKVTNQMKWRLVYSKMGLPPSNSAAHQIKNAYKKYLHAFEDFYRKLGSSMGTISRPGRQSRQSSSRGILPFRDRDKDSSPRSPRTEKPLPKDDKAKEDDKSKGKTDEQAPAETTEEAGETPAPQEESDSETVRRTTPRREKAQKEEQKSDKKEDPKARKKEEDKKKEETPKEDKKKEEKREERKSLRQSLKEEEKKESSKVKEEEKKKDEGKAVRILRKDLNEKEEESKKEPTEEAKEAQKKRVSRRKSTRVEEEKKDGDDKEEEEEKSEDKKEEVKEKPQPASAKKERPQKKKPEEEDSENKDQESDEASDEDTPTDSQDKEELPLGTKLRVRYGRGRNQKIYEAKIIEHGTEGQRRNYLVHYAGWNTRNLQKTALNDPRGYDEWIKSDRIENVVDKPETNRLKRKNMANRSPKVQGSSTSPVAQPEIPLLKKRGRQSTTQQVPSPGGPAVKSTPAPAPPTSEPKTPKTKPVTALPTSASKTRSTRSTSTDVKPETVTPNSGLKHRITRRSSGINEAPGDSPIAGDVDGEAESDMESEPAPTSAAGDVISDHEDYDEPKELEMDISMEEPEKPSPSVSEGADFDAKPAPNIEEDSLEAEDSTAKQGEPAPCIVPVPEESSMPKEPPVLIEPVLPPPLVEAVTSAKESSVEKVLEPVKEVLLPVKPHEPVVVAPAPELKKEVEKIEEMVPQLEPEKEVPVQEEVQPPVPEEEEKSSPPAPAVIDVKPEVVVAATALKNVPMDDPTIPQLKKIELDLPSPDEKKEGKEKEKARHGKKVGRESKKSRQNEMRTSLSEIPTLEPMTTPAETKPPVPEVAPSPYDFNDADADSPSPWQPEITKKWEPNTTKPLPVFRDVKMELKKSLETEKKKVKKKVKKPVEEVSGEVVDNKPPTAESPTKPSEKKVAKDLSSPSPELTPDKPTPTKKSKGRKKKEAGDVKPDTSSYEETVNSVVESIKADQLVHIPVPELLEPKEEKPAKKRKSKVLEPSSTTPTKGSEKDSDTAKKEPGKAGGKAVKGKTGTRKKKEVKGLESSVEPAPTAPLPMPSLPSLDSQNAIGSSMQQQQQDKQQPNSTFVEPVPVNKQPRLEAELPSSSLLSSSSAPSGAWRSTGSSPAVPKTGPTGVQLLSMASIRPVPSTSSSGTAGGGGGSGVGASSHSDRLAPSIEGRVETGVRQAGAVVEPRADCAGDVPKAACSGGVGGNTVLDNTPPTTPENDLDEANSASSSSEVHDNLKEDLFSLDSGERTSKGGSESPPGCDFSLSSTSSENLPSSSSGVQSGGKPSQSSETVTTKRKRKEESSQPSKRKKLISRSTRAERNKKSPKYGDEDSQSRSPFHQNGTDSVLVVPGCSADSSKNGAPRPQKFHFADDLGEHLKGEARIQFLLDKMKEIRKVYQSIRSEVAAIDRKRKRYRRREKERESSQASTGDRDGS